MEYRKPIDISLVKIKPCANTRLVEVYKIPVEKLREDIAHAETEIFNKRVEHLIVYTKEGVVYHLVGRESEVSAYVINENLSDSIFLHNHPKVKGFEENGPSRNDFFNAIDFKVREFRVIDQKNRFVMTFTPKFMKEIHSGGIPNRGILYDTGYEIAKKKHGNGLKLISLVWAEVAGLNYGMGYYKEQFCGKIILKQSWTLIKIFCLNLKN